MARFAKVFEFEEAGEIQQVLFTISKSAETGEFVIQGVICIQGVVFPAILNQGDPSSDDYRTSAQIFQELDEEEARQFWANMVSAITEQMGHTSSSPDLKVVK